MSLPEHAVPRNRASSVGTSSVSAALAAARAETQAILQAGARVAREEGGHSLAEMAQRDLDAALQLLADRAQYITGATGAAIALRCRGKNDMLCRASAGSNAPELGALLSTEFGLSGESVRTRQLLRCDDAERDARVNRDVCRRLGIASVVVMPVVKDDEVLGVFELFSGTANAFGERDFSAVQRLGEMVETAVRLAEATQSLPERLGLEKGTPKVEAGKAEDQILDEDLLNQGIVESATQPRAIAARESCAQNSTAPLEPEQNACQQNAEEPKPSKIGTRSPATAEPNKPLFWSAAQNLCHDEAKPSPADQSHVPPVLRNLHKCTACGFPVSAGRGLCVECEEKKWRGQ
jgi:GAF domain-containing protein